MSKRLTRIAPWQAGKVFAIIYFVLSFFVVVPLALFSAMVPSNAPGPHFGIGFVIVLPFMYALGGLIFVPLACWIYNLAAKLVGGLEITVTDRQDA
jgi:Transmembrane domain of unknown function (DUF3566)